jgi:hypothetical protein
MAATWQVWAGKDVDEMQADRSILSFSLAKGAAIKEMRQAGKMFWSDLLRFTQI